MQPANLIRNCLKSTQLLYTLFNKADGLRVKTFEGQLATLRFSDWPDEIMCATFWDSEEQDWEEISPNWTLPPAPEEESTKELSDDRVRALSNLPLSAAG